MFSIRKLFIKLAHAILKLAIEARGGQAPDESSDTAPASPTRPPVFEPAATPATPSAPVVSPKPVASKKAASKKAAPKKAPALKKSPTPKKPVAQKKAPAAAKSAQSKKPVAKTKASVSLGDFPLGVLGEDTAHEDTVWIPRILWALEWAKRNGAEPANAATIARILREEAKTNVAATNTARAFRSLKKDKRGTGLWSGDKDYRISADGRKVLGKLLG